MKTTSVPFYTKLTALACAAVFLSFIPVARAQFTPTASGTYDYNNPSNSLTTFLLGTANFTQTPLGPQTVTFATAPTSAPTFNFTMGGANANLSLLGTGPAVTLTLGGDITVNSAGASVTIGDANLSLALGGSNRVFSVASGNTLTLAGVISGSNGFTVTNGGTVVITAANIYTGTTTVTNGQLTLKNTTGSGTGTGNVNVGASGVLQIGDTTASGALTGSITNAGSVVFKRTDSFTYAGVISGAGLVNKYGAGTLTLTSDQSYTGATNIYEGTLAFGSGLANGGVLGNIAVSSGATLAFSRSDNITYSYVVSGAGNFVKNGTGTLTLGNTNAFTGAATINTGTLSVGIANALPAVAATVASGATLDIANNLTLSTLTTAGTTTVASGKTLTLSGGALTGVVSGLGGFTKTGSNSLTLTSNQAYTGPTTISNGTLIVGAADTLPTSTALSLQAAGSLNVAFNQTIGSITGLSGSTVALGSGATLTLGSSSGTQLSSVISGAGALALAGTGSLILTEANLFTGGITIGAGSTLKISGDANLGAVPGAATSGQLTFNGGSLQATAGFTLNANRGIALGSGGATIYTDTGVSVSYGGIIAGTGGLIKSSPGTLTLGGANIYTGATTITGGKLVATNATGSATGSGSVTVSNGAIFGGTGTITGPLVLNSGGIISPGITPGTLTVGATTFAGGAQFDVKINNATGAVGTGWNLLSIAGALTLNATSGSPFTVNLNSLTLGNVAGALTVFDPSLAYNWQFVTASGGVTGFDATAFQFNTALFQNSLGTGHFFVSQSGNNLLLNFTPVPEPATWALLALGLAPVALALRRRKIS